MDTKEKNGKIACAGAAGSMGLAGLAGACSIGCGFVAAPMFGLLTSIGLGTVATILPKFQIPLYVLALGLGIYSITIFAKRKNVLGAVVTALFLGGGTVFMAWQMISAGQCSSDDSVNAVLKKLSPETKIVFQKGVYTLWPQLGRAPTFAEIQAELGFESEKPIENAFSEMQRLGYKNILYSGTKTIKWLWPLSSIDHGVEVTLSGAKPVHARCAIDALGMSAMYDKPARISVKTPLDQKVIEIEISGNQIVQSSNSVLISEGDGCDDMLFFASEDEFNRFVKSRNRKGMQLYSLEQALERGIKSFGKVLKS